MRPNPGRRCSSKSLLSSITAPRIGQHEASAVKVIGSMGQRVSGQITENVEIPCDMHTAFLSPDIHVLVV